MERIHIAIIIEVFNIPKKFILGADFMMAFNMINHLNEVMA